MNEIMGVIENYEVIWKEGLKVITVAVVLLLLTGIFRQLRRLNNSLKSITGNMQAYFDVILTEESESEREMQGENKEACEDKIAETEVIKKREEEEKLFNAVLQEYFS